MKAIKRSIKQEIIDDDLNKKKFLETIGKNLIYNDYIKNDN